MLPGHALLETFALQDPLSAGPALGRTGTRHVIILKWLDPRAILGRPTVYGLHSDVAAPEARKRFFVERFLYRAPGARPRAPPVADDRCVAPVGASAGPLGFVS